MQIRCENYNGVENLINESFQSEWEELEEVLSGMPLHLKPSRQKGMKGDPIFDPVATNKYIRENLTKLSWEYNASVPTEYQVLGQDVDFTKSGAIIEVQFSNYPFLSNNVVRTELFHRSEVKFAGEETAFLVVVTKAHMFPASNSTLYHEQGVGLLKALDEHEIFNIPIRLVGLFEDQNAEVPAIWSEYPATYSREAGSQANSKCRITPGSSAGSRCNLEVL